MAKKHSKILNIYGMLAKTKQDIEISLLINVFFLISGEFEMLKTGQCVYY